MSDSEGSTSSSDAEELERCREAAMPAWGLEQRPRSLEKPKAGAANTQLPTTQPSLRHKVDEHEQDGSELQTTPEFRAHVAKKLGALLDSGSLWTWSKQRAEAGQVPGGQGALAVLTPPLWVAGFRLFFTSIPGAPEKEAAPHPRRKRMPSSSSSEDGDEELQRCREAAVSASDILQESAIHGPVTVEEKAKKKKRKLKKKAKKEASADAAAAATSKAATGKQGKESTELNGAQAPLGTKKKKRKKKAKRASEAAPFPPAKSMAAMPAHRAQPVGMGPN
uniref:Protein CUSTOS n=1 Tax=Catagonus wagneri TaxID=51154 RepID=A0A8C3WM99_9CETA